MCVVASVGVEGALHDIESLLAGMETTIEEAVASESGAEAGRVAAAIREAAEKKGDTLGEAEVARGVDFVVRYVRAVPPLLREAQATSKGTFAEAKMDRMVQAAAAYWSADDDVIHDDEGLFGILDDAYCTVSLLLALSARFEAEAGQRLVAADLAGPTDMVRQLLGPSNAGRLDAYVVEALSDASVGELLASLAEHAVPTPPSQTRFTTDDDALILELFGVL